MKNKRLLLLLVLALFISACGPAAGSDTQDTGANASDGAVAESGETVDLNELLTDVSTATQNIKSVAIDMLIHQTIGMPAGEGEAGQPLAIDSNVRMDLIVDPLLASVEMDMELPEEAQSDEPLTMLMYMDKDYIYMQMPGFGEMEPEWMKMSITAMGGPALDPESLKQTMGNADSLSALKEVEDELEVTDQGDAWLIHYEGSGETAQKLFEMQLQAAGNSAASDIENADMKIDHIDYNYVIGKSDILPRSLKADLSYSINLEGQTLPITQKLEGNYSRINEIDAIDIPQAALDAEETNPNTIPVTP